MPKEASIVQDWINEGMEEGEMKALQGAILDVLEERFGIIKSGKMSAKVGSKGWWVQ